MRTLIGLLDLLFGCRHSNMSRVFSIRSRTYRVCCDCGAEFEYSLKTMSIRQDQTAPTRHVLREA